MGSLRAEPGGCEACTSHFRKAQEVPLVFHPAFSSPPLLGCATLPTCVRWKELAGGRLGGSPATTEGHGLEGRLLDIDMAPSPRVQKWDWSIWWQQPGFCQHPRRGGISAARRGLAQHPGLQLLSFLFWSSVLHCQGLNRKAEQREEWEGRKVRRLSVVRACLSTGGRSCRACGGVMGSRGPDG